MGSIPKHVSGETVAVNGEMSVSIHSPTGQADGDGIRSFDIVGLSSEHASTPTGVMDEVLLVSWLLVLLRTREDGQIRYEWAYNDLEHKQVTRCLSADEVMPSLQSSIGQVAASISSHITAVEPSPRESTSSPASLLLSTGSLSKTSSEGTKDESDILHLEIRLHHGRLDIRPVWHSDNMLPYTVKRHIETLVDTVQMCISKPDASVEECIRPSKHDMDTIWSWNHQLPPSYHFCMHEMIAERAQQYPDKEAIASWDGSLTYSQVDRYSTLLASSLREMKADVPDFIPVCFEKSRWTIVAVLAVMKVGAAMVLMDPTLPLARLQNMAKQVGATAMLASRKQHEFSASIVPEGKLVVVEENTFAQLSDSQVLPPLPPVLSSAAMYMIFTSGSTGTPKGVMISHKTYTSSAIPRATAVGYSENSRVLDFASYAFDVSIDSMLLTLGNGGCLCIPSDEDRMNNINGVMRMMQVTYAGITPSMARLLDPDVIASLSGLGLGGEAASTRDVNLWGQDTRIIIGYGPCECTIGCTVNSSAATGRDYISIGPGNGAAIWIANPNDHDSLMPVGAVGELLVEGPIVGQGYFNDPDKTAAAFINDPPWLVAGHQGYAGRRGRLYKTGDLGIYDPDGSGGIVFVGRKDTQVKLRGQRVELGEIESRLTSGLPPEVTVIAEVIKPVASGAQPTLVVFVAPQSTKASVNAMLELAQLAGELDTSLSEADAELVKVLPRYMVPTAYIPVNYIPTLVSGKTDRKKLREFGATVDLRQLELGTTSTTAAARELSGVEHRLRQAWSLTLKLDSETIRPGDNFFALGGDSLAAMRLVSVCRTEGLDLTVTNIFGSRTLAAMAAAVVLCDLEALPVETPAFSMISQPVSAACLEASQACDTDPAAIEDIYPCTPTQESLFTFSLKSIQAYVAQRVARIPPQISLGAWKKAWEAVVAANPILRTRVVQLQDPGLQQVVLREGINWTHSTGLAQYLENDKNDKMDLGQSLARYAIVDDPDAGQRYMVWTIHHVVYDGWSEPLLLEKVRNALQSQDIEAQTHMRDFVKYVRDTDADDIQSFWRQELKGAVGPQFPSLPSRDYFPTPDALVEHLIPLETGSERSAFTLATLIRGAWALVASQYTGSDDVVFGETFTGRDIPLPGVESISGPLVATVPVRVRIDRKDSVSSFLQTVQQTILARTPYQHMGMQNIRKVSQDAQYACEAGTGLVIQPEPDYAFGNLGFEQGDPVREALNFNPYPLMLAFGIGKGGLRVAASFDSSLIAVTQMRRILAQLETTLSQLKKDLSTRVEQISCLSASELDQIWCWNQTPPLSLQESSGRLRADASIVKGSKYPQTVVSWVCDARNPSLLAPIGCAGELCLEGALFAGETIEPPGWLLAGSFTHVGRTGRIQPTGDIVELQEDGSLIFVGRKESVVPVHGHAVNIAQLEAHLTQHLPPSTRAATALYSASSDGTQPVTGQALVILIEQQPSTEESVELLWVKHDVDLPSFETSVCATIPVSLALALNKLDKSIQNSLPSHMSPLAYVVVEKMPVTMDEVDDHSLLNQLASKLPRHVLDQLDGALKEWWTKGSLQANLTSAESILQAAWAKVLGTSPERIDVEDNFFRLGGDSVLAMKLVSSLRAQGHGLTVADIFQHMRLADAARVLKVNQVSTGTEQRYKPFSTLGASDVGRFLSEVVQPKLVSQHGSVLDVLPVTNSQSLDVRATVHVPRTSIQYTMLYFDQGIDRQQLFRACHDLVKAHEILRTVFIEHESTLFQVVLDTLDSPVTTELADKHLEQYVVDLCKTHAESDFHLGSSFLRMFHVQGTAGRHCLIIGLSHAQYDGMSLPMLLRDLETLYTGQKMTDAVPFSSYVARTRDSLVQTKAIKYWSNLLYNSSLSFFSETSMQAGDKGLFQSSPVDIEQPPKDITTANFLTAAWALVLARRLQKPDVTFGSVTSGRGIDLANVENIMGPCYQFTPIRVPFKSQWTAMDLMQHVQSQSAESAAHDFLGFETISTKCTQWSTETRFFDSVVHHQDFEDFDTMPFAGGTCRVEILNPHGDAPYPLKVVSFVRGGQIHLGVVGSERDSAFIGSVLNELVVTAQELARLGPEPILLNSKLF